MLITFYSGVVSMGAIDASDEFELKIPELSRVEKVPSRAKLGHFNFRAEAKLTICTMINSFFSPKLVFS